MQTYEVDYVSPFADLLKTLKWEISILPFLILIILSITWNQALDPW